MFAEEPHLHRRQPEHQPGDSHRPVGRTAYLDARTEALRQVVADWSSRDRSLLGGDDQPASETALDWFFLGLGEDDPEAGPR